MATTKAVAEQRNEGSGVQAAMPFEKSFAGHETFAFRFGWLKKGLDQLESDAGVFQREDAIVRLGVGKNMVSSIKHWCLATRVAEEEPGSKGRRCRPTTLGRNLLKDGGWDPFMEDEGTLWLLHWNLTSAGSRAATWYWAFNRFHEHTFTREGMAEGLARDLKALGWFDIPDTTLKRDIDCFVHTYLARSDEKTDMCDVIEYPLTVLDLLVREAHSQRMRFEYGPKQSLPAALFAYALAEHWNRTNAERQAIEFREIIRAEGSPALIFKLDEDSVLSYLDHVGEVTDGAMVFQDTALVRRVVKRKQIQIDSAAILEAYYDTR